MLTDGLKRRSEELFDSVWSPDVISGFSLFIFETPSTIKETSVTTSGLNVTQTTLHDAIKGILSTGEVV